MEEDIDIETARQRQSRVSKSGDKWEEYVKIFLEEELKDTEIEIIWEKDAKKDDKLNKILTLPTGFEEETEWDDVDLLAIKDGLPIAVINCKSSIHGRYSFYFWGLVFSINTKIKFIMATPDAGAGGKKWKSEWGSHNEPNKYRSLAQRYIDGVYVQNVKEFCKNIKEDQGTDFGDVIRHLEELPLDLKRWSRDLKFYTENEEKGGKITDYE